MKDKLVPVYRALTVDDAQRLADRLKNAGVEAFVDSTDAPMYGITQGPSSKVVLVRKAESAHARDLVKQWGFKWHPTVAQEEWSREETGLELPIPERPSDDSPNEFEGEGNERMNADRPGPESAEVEEFITESGEQRSPGSGEIVGFGMDRPLEQDADVDRPEVQDQELEKLDLRQQLDEPETGTPAAKPRGGGRKSGKSRG